MNSLVRDLANAFPNSVRFRRGKLGLDGLVDAAVENEADRLIILQRWKGGPGKLELRILRGSKLTFFPPLMLISGTRLAREYRAGRTPKIKAVCVGRGAGEEAMRLAKAFSDFLGLPILHEDSNIPALRVDEVRSHQHTVTVTDGGNEVGPSITLKKLFWEET